MSGICIDLQHIETSQFHHYVYEIVVPVLFGVITITGLVGNLLVIFVIVSKKQMRTVTNLLLLNLAVSDLFFVPLLTAYNYWHYVEWIIGEEACQFMHFIFNVTAYVTVFTLVLISIVRYMVVVRNTTTGHLRTKPRILMAIACVWIMSFALSLPVPHKQTHIHTHTAHMHLQKHIHTNTHRHKHTHTGTNIHTHAHSYVLPLFTISLLYVSIIHHIYRKRMSVCTVQGRPRIRSELKTRQMLVTVLFAFFTFLLPIHIQMLLHYYDALPQNDLYQILSIFFNCLAYTNSVINPFIYNHSSKDFRDAFREVVCCHV
ncbi:hypothetical protein HELRODRAFT_87810, partial [Helobdella robusta]|uniref:G-protein coupled receptors family 1 profile domain-containing protein n=1 Tax=Helobdella robusta TaxID=6412 RepID=T1G6V7_HELRO